MELAAWLATPSHRLGNEAARAKTKEAFDGGLRVTLGLRRLCVALGGVDDAADALAQAVKNCGTNEQISGLGVLEAVLLLEIVTIGPQSQVLAARGLAAQTNHRAVGLEQVRALLGHATREGFRRAAAPLGHVVVEQILAARMWGARGGCGLAACGRARGRTHRCFMMAQHGKMVEMRPATNPDKTCGRERVLESRAGAQHAGE